MKRRFVHQIFAPIVLTVGGLGVVSLGGCPIYSADTCAQDPNCVELQPTGNPPPPRYDSGVPKVDSGVDSGGDTGSDVSTPSDCGSCDDGYICTNSGTNRYRCSAYDCRAIEKKCATGSACAEASPGVWSCKSTIPTDCAKTGCITGYTCAPGNPGERVCVSSDPNACVADADCQGTKTGPGSLCLGGVCKAAKDLCTDSTQCKAGKSCLNGRCITQCAAASDAGPAVSCENGYVCNATNSLCTETAGSCGAAGDAGPSCSGKCVNDVCADKCGIDGSCKAGLVCVAGGCVRDDRPIFFCDKTGTADGSQDVCAVGSICLHHNCYLTCTGAADATTCAKADKFNVCKEVLTSSGVHFVCGSSSNLGTECDPTTTPPKACAAGKVCLDGFCK